MDKLNRELMIPEAAEEDPKSFEILRMWGAGGQQRVSIRWDIWEDPSVWGIALADFAGHVANAFEKEKGMDPSTTLSEIKKMFLAELSNPTDRPQGSVRNKRTQHRS